MSHTTPVWKKSGLATTMLAVLLSAGCLSATGADTGMPTPDFIATAREYLGRAEAAGFSGAVAVARNGDVLLAEGYGALSCGGEEPVSAETPFYAASLSKAFTAAAVLKLEERGALRVSDPIHLHLPDVPADKHAITLHHLLAHTSGIARLRRGLTAPPLDARDYAAAALAAPLTGEPGREHRYSNTGYSLLAAIVQEVSGEPFEAFVRREILEPSGMTRTGFVTEPHHWPVHELARACNGTIDQGDAVVSHHRPLSWEELGAIGLVTTAPDLMRWVIALRSGELLPAASVDLMFSDHADGYGYGWVRGSRSTGPTLHWHTGQLLPEGWNAQLRIYDEDDLVLVVLSNRQEGEPLGWVVARTLDRLLQGGDATMPPPLRRWAVPSATNVPPPVEGRYELEGGGDLRLVRRGGHLYLDPTSQQAVSLMLGIGEERSAALVGSGEQARRFFNEVLERAPEGVPETVAGRPAGEWLPRFAATWDWLHERFGVVEGYRVLHAVPAPFGQDAAMVYVRLEFQEGATTVRTLWIDGAFQSMSDEGAFIGATPAVAVEPAPLRLTRTGPARYTGFRLSGSTLVELRLSEDATGCLTARVEGSAGVARARAEQCASR
jgi:CubicO group peptidase (beta-lactamase class C family)